MISDNKYIQFYFKYRIKDFYYLIIFGFFIFLAQLSNSFSFKIFILFLAIIFVTFSYLMDKKYKGNYLISKLEYNLFKITFIPKQEKEELINKLYEEYNYALNHSENKNVVFEELPTYVKIKEMVEVNN